MPPASVNRLPDKMVKIFDSLEYEEEGFVSYKSITISNGTAKIKLNLMVAQKVIESWVIEVSNLLGHEVDLSKVYGGENLSLFDDHPLLWNDSDSWAELYFHGRAHSPEKLLAEIYECHKEIFADWVDVEKYLNSEGLTKLCLMPFGSFAKGPTKLMSQYAEVLEQNGIEPNLYGNNNRKQLEKEGNEHANRVLIFGSSYFISDCFTFRRLPKWKLWFSQ